MFRGQAAPGAAGYLWWRLVANEAALQPSPSQSSSPEFITHFTQGKEVQLQLETGLGGEQCGVLVWYTDTGIFLNLGSHSRWTRPQLIGWFQSTGLQDLASLSEVGDHCPALPGMVSQDFCLSCGGHRWAGYLSGGWGDEELGLTLKKRSG